MPLSQPTALDAAVAGEESAAIKEHPAGNGRNKKKKEAPPGRSEQGSNLRGETPLDFKSNALTTRPSLLMLLALPGCTLIGRSARRRPRPTAAQPMGAGGVGPAPQQWRPRLGGSGAGGASPDSPRESQPEAERPRRSRE